MSLGATAKAKPKAQAKAATKSQAKKASPKGKAKAKQNKKEKEEKGDATWERMACILFQPVTSGSLSKHLGNFYPVLL